MVFGLGAQGRKMKITKISKPLDILKSSNQNAGCVDTCQNDLRPLLTLN